VNCHQQVLLTGFLFSFHDWDLGGPKKKKNGKKNLSQKTKEKKGKESHKSPKILLLSNKPKPREKQLEQEKKKKSRKAAARHKFCNPARHKY
jgi:hypothetical protein